MSRSRTTLRIGKDFTLPPEMVTETFAILANKGRGKTNVAVRMTEQLHRAGLPVVVLDVKGDWWGIRSSADGKGPGLPFIIFGGDHADVPLEPTAGQLLADLIVDERVPAVLDLSHMSKTKARQFASDFAERLYFRNRDPLHVVIDEADVLIPQRASAETARLIGAMEDIAKRGRGRGIGLTIATQRGQEVAKSVLELVETVLLLGITGKRTIDAVRDWISVNADNDDVAARDVIASLPSLPVGEGWVWSPAFLRTVKRVQFLLCETFDSHATPKPGQVRRVPKSRADIDLDALGAEIAATVQRAKDADPRALRAEVDRLRKSLTAAESANADLSARNNDYQEWITKKSRENDELRNENASVHERLAYLETHGGLSKTDRNFIYSVASQMHRDAASLQAISERLREIAQKTQDEGQPVRSARAEVIAPSPIEKPVAIGPAPEQADRRIDRRAAGQTGRKTSREVAEQAIRDRKQPGTWQGAAARSSTARSDGERPQFRAGAQRMLESLGRMAPLRLTKAQWGTVARMKHTSGTFSTYLGELRRAGLVEENSAGFTLTDAGFEYLGGRPAPMTADELQEHYLSILRSGAARMLQAIMDAYPSGLTKDEISQATGITATSGTFSTYLGELRRNGLVEQTGSGYTATDILMRGAQA